MPLKLSSLFSDHAILQREQQIPVWGVSSPGALIRAQLAGNEAYTRASDAGIFMLYLPPLKAGGPYELSVSDGTSTIVAHDILIGEVWLASGQSNMQYTIGTNWAQPATDGKPLLNQLQKEEFLSLVDHPEKLRFIKVPQIAPGTRQQDFQGQWHFMDKANAPDASAVAAWFGYFLQKELDIPVGIIVSAWGGTFAHSWASREAMLCNPDLRDFVLRCDRLSRPDYVWDRTKLQSPSQLEDPAAAPIPDPGNQAVNRGWANAAFDDKEWKAMRIPGSWIVQKIAGNGALWVRQQITIPQTWKDQELKLHLGPIDKTDITYFNGTEIGRSGEGLDVRFWNVPRTYSIPAGIVRPGQANLIAIRAYSFQNDGAFLGQKQHYYLECPARNERLPLGVSWKSCAEHDFGVIPRAVVYGPGQPNSPGILFDSMINPLIPFAMRGVLWYQGENDTPAAAKYAKRLQTLFNDWRFRWGAPELPVLIVQLAGFGPQMPFEQDAIYAVIREQQELFCKTDKHAFLTTAIDVGDAKDIHPQNKKDVGYRLAMNALHNVFGFSNILPCGPTLSSCMRNGHEITLTFDYAEGLRLLPNAQESFQLSEDDDLFFPADSIRMQGNSLIVSSSKVPCPTAIRYAWGANPISTVFNGAGFPAFPFRINAL